MSDRRPQITEQRILWWMAHTGDTPYVDADGRPLWRSDHHSSCCPHGLGEPFLTRPTVARMLSMGLVELEPETYPAHVVAFPDPSWSQHQRNEQAWRRRAGQPTMKPIRRALLLTDKGRALAPEKPPYPWRPQANGLSDITNDETERLRKAAVHATFQLAGALHPSTSTPRLSVVTAGAARNVVPFVRSSRPNR